MIKHILGIGSPIMDAYASISESDLKYFPVEKGSMAPLSSEELEKIIQQFSLNPIYLPGGCATNTLKILQLLGNQTTLKGKIGKDHRGQIYLENLASRSVQSRCVFSDDSTGLVLVLITPDGQRTFLTFTGSSSQLQADEIYFEDVKDKDWVHLDGYTLFCERVTERVMQYAKRAGSKISFDICSPFLASNYTERIFNLLKNYIDVLFMNADEAKSLTSLSPEDACKKLGAWVEYVVVTMNTEGFWVSFKEEIQFFPVQARPALDTTGAGDVFAGGFIHGLLSNQSLEMTAALAAELAGEVVGVLGPELSLSSI